MRGTPVIGQRVIYRGILPSLDGKAGVVMGTRSAPGSRLKEDRADIRFDHEPRRVRVVAISNLTLEGASKMGNFKTLVQSTIATLFAGVIGDSAKEQAVRRLGVAAEIVRLGEADKKKAKTELTKLGIITGDVQNGVVFDSDRYVMTAKTNAASTRFDQAAVEAAMIAEKVPAAARRRIIAAGTVENKAATSFTVEAK